MDVPTEINERREDSYKILDDSSSIPVVDVSQTSETRRKTDRVFFFIFLACLGILIPFQIYTLYNSDINRLKGCDACGNICGQKNIKDVRWSCSGQDMTHKPVLKDNPRECAKTDDKSVPTNFGSTIISSSAELDTETLFVFINKAEWKLLLLNFLPVSLCLILVVLFRYVPAVAVWGTAVLYWIILACLLKLSMGFVLGGIPFIILLCFLLLIWIISNVHKVRLTTIILKEATRAVFEDKMMSYVAIATLIMLAIILLISSSIALHMCTAGKLEQTVEGHITYVKDKAMVTTMVLNSILLVWSVYFIFGAHYMIVGGAVARSYTSKNQDGIQDSVMKSGRATLKYHLGTIALGSVLIILMMVPRTILQFLSKFSGPKEKVDSWLKCLDGYFTTNTYIVTAMYATSFIPSGRKAAKILKLSIGNTMDLNNFASSVIFMSQALVVFVSALGAFLTLYYIEGVFGLCSVYFTLHTFVFASFSAQAILGTLGASTDTLFLCASEELVKNKEADFPYTMTLAEFTEGSNRLLLQKVQNRPPSNVIEKSFYIKLFLFIFVSVSCVMYTVAFFI